MKKTTKGNKKRHHILGLFRIFATRNNILSNSSTGYYHLFQKNCLHLQLKHFGQKLFIAGEPRKFKRQDEYAISFTEETSVWTIAYSIAKAFLGPTS